MRENNNKKADEITERALQIGYFIVETGYTLRQLENHFGVSKSTIHKDINERLIHIDNELYFKARDILDKNRNERSLRGGLALKNKRDKAID